MDFNLQQVQALHAQLREYLGATICAALEDETVTDIKVGGDGVVWLVQHQVGDVCTGTCLSEDDRLLALNTMSALLDKKINAECSRIFGKLPLTGDRIQGFVPPTALPSFYIRVHAPEIFTFANYIAKGICEPWHVEVIRKHVRQRSNVVFSGGTGSGKTTLLNTVLQEELIESKEHLAIIEDTEEIQCDAPNVSRFLTSETVSLQQLIADAMRIFPRRLVIGETRGLSGVAILEAWSTGHSGGFTTVHANNAMGVFERFAQFCQQAELPPLWRLMQSTIGLIVHMELTEKGRRIVEIKEVQRENTVEKIPIELIDPEPSQAVIPTLN